MPDLQTKKGAGFFGPREDPQTNQLLHTKKKKGLFDVKRDNHSREHGDLGQKINPF